jgi:hypothetical protein
MEASALHEGNSSKNHPNREHFKCMSWLTRKRLNKQAPSNLKHVRAPSASLCLFLLLS